MLADSAEKCQGASGAACMARNAHKVINAHSEFVMGLKRTSEPNGGGGFFSLKWSTHTHTSSRQSRTCVCVCVCVGGIFTQKIANIFRTSCAAGGLFKIHWSI
jgi:hypothetical protein